MIWNPVKHRLKRTLFGVHTEQPSESAPAPVTTDPSIADFDLAMEWTEKFLDTFQILLCKRCTRPKAEGDFCVFPPLPQEKNPKLPMRYPLYPDVHHKGSFYSLCKSEQRLSLNDLEKWFNCHEHGLFHGLMTAFCTFLVSPEIDFYKEIDRYGEITYAETLIMSGLLHDFARTQGSYEQHDARLFHYFPDLVDETYEHMQPRKVTALIKADRLELQRYSDYKSWCHQETLAACADQQTWKIINAFYKHIRPALLSLVQNQDSVWIRHGIEDFANYKGESSWPPSQSYDDVNNAGWCIEVGRLPLSFHQCINHATSNWPWKVLAGIRPFDGTLNAQSSGMRDHFQINGPATPLDEWVFLYGKNELYANVLEPVRADLLKKGVRMIKWRVAYDFLRVFQQIQDRMIVANWRVK